MTDPAAPEAHVVAMLAGFGVPTDEIDEAIIGAILQQFGPGLQALLDADLTAVAAERPCDPSTAPQ